MGPQGRGSRCRRGHERARRLYAGRTLLGHDEVRTLDDLFANVDVVSLHCPLTNETRDLVDEAALAAALTAGAIAGAALDSFASEPPSADNPLWRAPNLFATPHIGGVTADSARTMAETAARHIIHVLDGHAPDERSLARPDSLAA